MALNKNIVVIGGTSGIGLSASKYLISHGANITATGLVGPESFESDRYHFIISDACDESSAQEAIHSCVQQFGQLDGLFHVAGGSGRRWGDGPLNEMSLEAWDRTLRLNLTSVMLSNKAAVDHFLEYKRAGTILNMSTALAFSPQPRFFYTHAYAAAKSAIIGFSKSIASYYAAHNIRVNVIAPGLVDTPMASRAVGRKDIMDFIKTKQPLDGGRVEHPSDLDGAVKYFLSDESKFTTGQVLTIDGGWSLTDGQYG